MMSVVKPDRIVSTHNKRTVEIRPGTHLKVGGFNREYAARIMVLDAMLKVA